MILLAETYGVGMKAVYWAVGNMADTDLEPHVIVAWARRVALTNKRS
jgi:hypothetical protein